jgi:hypothetical protein
MGQRRAISKGLSRRTVSNANAAFRCAASDTISQILRYELAGCTHRGASGELLCSNPATVLIVIAGQAVTEFECEKPHPNFGLRRNYVRHRPALQAFGGITP